MRANTSGLFISLIATFLLVVWADEICAGPIEDGVAAAERGDYPAAFQLWQPLADNGNAEAQVNLGRLYHFGLGVTQDYSIAQKWYRLAASQDHALAQALLGLLYYDGLGVIRNDGEAVTWFRKAADKGEPLGQYLLGLAHMRGRGVPASAAEAEKWYRLAAKQGDNRALNNLGVMALQGLARPPNFLEAAEWFRLAAEQGHPESQLNLGLAFYNGWGVQQDYALAHAWFVLAARQGVADALQDKEIVEKLLTASQLAESHRRVDDWKPAPRRCSVHTLAEENDRIPSDGVSFSVTNVGKVPVAIRIVGDEAIISMVKAKQDKDDTNPTELFFGDIRYSYDVGLEKLGGQTTVVICY